MTSRKRRLQLRKKRHTRAQRRHFRDAWQDIAVRSWRRVWHTFNLSVSSHDQQEAPFDAAQEEARGSPADQSAGAL